MDAALASISHEKLQEWQAFEELDTPLSDRLDWGIAHIVQVLMNNGKPLREYMLAFGDYPMPPPEVTVAQTPEFIESQINIWCAGSNMVLAKKGIGPNG